MEQNKSLVKSTGVILAEDALRFFEVVRSFASSSMTRRIGKTELEIYFGTQDQFKILENLKAVIVALGKERGMEVFSKLKRAVQFPLLVPEDYMLDQEFAILMEATPKMIGQAFLAHHPKLESSPYTFHISDLSAETAEKFCFFLKSLPLEQAKEIVSSLNEKLLYLVLCFEAKDNDYEPVQVFSSALRGVTVHPELYFAFWFQHNMPELFRIVSLEICNPIHEVKRQEFYELWKRNHTSRQQAEFSGSAEDFEQELNDDDIFS